jgi:hypothetical protein
MHTASTEVVTVRGKLKLKCIYIIPYAESAQLGTDGVPFSMRDAFWNRHNSSEQIVRAHIPDRDTATMHT